LPRKINEAGPDARAGASLLLPKGTEAVEAAIKLARYVTGAAAVHRLLGGFQGRSMDRWRSPPARHATGGFFPTMPGVTHVPFPNPYRPLFAGA